MVRVDVHLADGSTATHVATKNPVVQEGGIIVTTAEGSFFYPLHAVRVLFAPKGEQP